MVHRRRSRSRIARRPLWMAVTAVLLLGASPGRAWAITVFDPANFSANTLQAARALVQIRHQLTQIRNQIQMIKSIDLATAREVRAVMDSIHAVSGLARELGDGLLRDNYGNLTLQQVQVLQARWNRQRRDAAVHAMHVQTAVMDAMPLTAGRVELIGASSKTAHGQKGAVQANTQMLGQLSSQMQHLQAVTVSAQRLAAVREAQRTAMLDYFRQRRLELHRDDTRSFTRSRVNDPFPRAR